MLYTVICVEISQRTGDMEYDTLVEGVAQFQYLGRKLEETDCDWMVVQRNISKTREIWRSLREILQREGEESRV